MKEILNVKNRQKNSGKGVNRCYQSNVKPLNKSDMRGKDVCTDFAGARQKWMRKKTLWMCR